MTNAGHLSRKYRKSWRECAIAYMIYAKLPEIRYACGQASAQTKRAVGPTGFRGLLAKPRIDMSVTSEVDLD